MPPATRADATRRRRQDILDAALACFSATGYDRTTLADIRTRAGASTGSIYHHFDSKEQIAASLYLEGVRATQDAGVAALLATDTAPDGIAALVGSYVGWVVANPAMATFLLQMRHERFLDDRDPVIDEMNDDAQRRTAAWFTARVGAGDLPDVAPEVLRAVVFGPCRHWAGTWLAGRAALSPDEAIGRLAAASHAALQALR